MKPGEIIAVEFCYPAEYGYDDVAVMMYKLEQLNPHNIVVYDEIENTRNVINLLSYVVVEVRTTTDEEKRRHEIMKLNKGGE